MNTSFRTKYPAATTIKTESPCAYSQVFLVDDDLSFLRSLDRMLRASGYEVRIFTSAIEFLEQHTEQSAGCVVADLNMPEINGLELQEKLTLSHNPLPFVFLTGQADISSSVIAMRQGAEDFLAKTAPRDQLLDAIERALDRDILERKHRSQQYEIQERFMTLTAREVQVLRHVLHGLLNKQIAAELGVDERTIKRHRAAIMIKLRVTTVVALIKLAIEAGIETG